MTQTARSAMVAFGTTFLAAPIVLMLLRHRQVLDHPNHRSSHVLPTTRGLGLAPAIGATIALLTVPVLHGSARNGLVVAAVGFGILGLIDDLRGVRPLPRFVAQLLLAITSLLWLLEDLSGPLPWRVVFAVGCALWLVAYVNAFNFMDGINGISAAQVLVAATAWWAIGQAENVPTLSGPALLIGATALAFAPFNFPTARGFLGDVGSYFLGAWLAGLTIVGLRAGLPPEAVIAPVSLYLADTATAIARRARAGEPWHLPHRSHTYQRLTQLGWSHTRTTLAVFVVMATASGLGAASLSGSIAVRAAGDIGLAALLVTFLASPTILDRHQATQLR